MTMRELQSLHSSSNIIRMTNSKRIKQADRGLEG
jgi:hypothetical protein